MADSRAQAYAQQLDLLTRQAEALTPEARWRILKLLDEANREILADVARSQPSSYNAARLQALKAQIDRVMAEFASQASSQVSELEAKTYEQTAVQIDATVAAGTGTLMVQPVVDRAMLQVVQGYTADLISGLTRDMSAKINAAIQRAFLGGLNLQQLVEQIGSTLEDGKFSGLFSQVGERAMSIATNEIMRVQSLASVARINGLAPHHPGLMKRWKHIPVALVPRIGHILANNQDRQPGEPFLVEGEELQYPRDPSGSAENTINCHCLVIPHLDDDQLRELSL
jgi:flagella basal body P-ring formation protein FlgA